MENTGIAARATYYALYKDSAHSGETGCARMNDDNSGEGSNKVIVDVQVSTRDIAPVLEKFGEMIARGIGIAYEPRRIRKRSKAVVAAVETMGRLKDSTLTDIQRRTLDRLLNEEVFKQENIERIAEGAESKLEPDAKPEDVETDWLSDFFEKARHISDEQMSTLWSSILAGETNSPGTFSKRTVATVYELSKSEAELFRNVCQYVVVSHDPFPFVFHRDPPKDCPNFIELSLLDEIGLINFGHASGFKQNGLPNPFAIQSGGVKLIASKALKANKRNSCAMGSILFTATGRQLYNISNTKTPDSHSDYVRSQITKQGFEVGIQT